MRKVLVFTLVIMFFALFSSVNAQSYKTGVGVRFSNNDAIIGTGISVKHFVSGSTALEAILSFDPVALGVLAEKHKPTKAQGLYWLYGGGAYVPFEGRNKFGALGILGLDYKFTDLPINVTLDWKPELYLINRVDFEPAAVGVSVRFAF